MPSPSWRSRLLLGAGLPTPPTRAQLLAGTSIFQGVRISTRQYGTFNVFGPDLPSLDLPEDRRMFYAGMRDAGTTVCHMGWAGDSYVSGGFTYRVPGPDLRWVGDLDGYCDRLAEILTVGGFNGILLLLPGDGETGVTRDLYGRQWLLDHITPLVHAMRTYRLGNLLKYTILVPGYDGVWYGWKDAQAVLDYGWFMRRLVGDDAYLGLEYGAGICHLGEGKDDYTRKDTHGQPIGLQWCDLFLQEFAYRPHDEPNQMWQIGARMLGPKYRRPVDQPRDDDPDSPFAAGSAGDYLSEGTPRGPFATWGWEYLTYGWVRERDDLATVRVNRAYIQNLGYPSVG